MTTTSAPTPLLPGVKILDFTRVLAGRLTDRALQIHSGYGHMNALPLERYARDVRIMRIYEGSSD